MDDERDEYREVLLLVRREMAWERERPRFRNIADAAWVSETIEERENSRAEE